MLIDFPRHFFTYLLIFISLFDRMEFINFLNVNL